MKIKVQSPSWAYLQDKNNVFLHIDQRGLKVYFLQYYNFVLDFMVVFVLIV